MKVLLVFAIIWGLLLGGCASAGPTAPNSGPNSSVSASPTPPIASLSPETRLLFVTAAPVAPSDDPTSAYQPPPLKSPPKFVVIDGNLSFGGGQPGTPIPSGSSIYHWRNKITEFIGPDNSVMYICKDEELAQINTPGGKSATYVYGVPNGALVDTFENDKNITIIYGGPDRRSVIATIINKPEDFPYAPTQIRNSRQQYVAIGSYADGSTLDITSKVRWNSSDISVATVTPGGLVAALADGNTQITASLNSVTSLPVDLTVDTLLSISLSTWSGVGPSMPFYNLAVGSTRQVWASGTYSDGLSIDITAEVTWASADESVATVDPGGLITGVSPGSDRVTASLYGITSETVVFAVVAASQTPATGH